MMKEGAMTEDAAPFALVVRFTVRPGSEADFDDLIARTTAAIRDREPGTLVYACHRVEGAPRQRIFYELYRDEGAFDEHNRQEHVKAFLSARTTLLESTEVDRLTLADGKTPAAQAAGNRG
jgi:quinol monooxygenase YgiN